METDMNKLLRSGWSDHDALEKIKAAGDDVDAQKAAAAQAVGLPPAVAHRLVGDSPEALAEDARELAESAAHLAPEPQTSFDGGVREMPPPGPPSMSSLFRAERDQRRQEVNDGARAYDRLDRRFGK